MNQIENTFFFDQVWKSLEEQAYRFFQVDNLEKKLVDIYNPEDFSNMREPNFILFSTSSVLPLRDSRFQSAHGGVIGYHIASKDRFYILGQYHKPLCVTHFSESLFDPMMSILDLERIKEISIEKVPILYSSTYQLELMNNEDRERIEKLRDVPNYFNS